MKLVAIEQEGRYRLGVKLNDGIIDILSALEHMPDSAVPTDAMDVIAGGEQAVAILRSYAERLLQTPNYGAALLLREDEVQFGPCVPAPNKIICVGLNYRQHAIETNAAIPQFPILFNKFNNTLTGHLHDVVLPERVTNQVDYEAELVIVIGKTAKNVSKEQALDYVFGYCCANDLSARDLQTRTSQWLLGKSCDGFSPLGPYLVTKNEIADPNDLAIKCFVNGDERQHSNTSDMIFPCDEIVSYISQHMTLVPGDIILTGTPEGVVLGYPADQRVYLNPGDVVTIEIEGLGKLTNRMVSEA
ncbi:fumarylacetoacetate hydrolase family protein [Paenibacillus harenae]|uniref:2-keto-4-pentenoate hydratase/2-oxohepta-3-ene-1,7-dioic acid hydratase in catechol pathway n=1 Tax=Paenibacillus harenae TaxID=306543 RepID=A0ABT9U0I9_PAEHA|nr:fumarylacetoacetate hydrolase family protein [Paenibacillus harenae]MDQ0112616.1 2-keto-4-pentenoate hydratase/2-oxohepta-3-ene-1,7-dioic acid hydratase in catechol pathway [Paenibacillus harenae]